MIMLIALWIALCFVTAWVGGQKGRSGAGFFFLAFFLSPLIGLLVAAALPVRAAAPAKKGWAVDFADSGNGTPISTPNLDRAYAEHLASKARPKPEPIVDQIARMSQQTPTPAPVTPSIVSSVRDQAIARVPRPADGDESAWERMNGATP
jgi:hypothetical protein